MIQTAWPYLCVLLLAAGLFPTLERRTGWRVFQVLPPIVFTYLFVTALSVAGLWQHTGQIVAAQKLVVGQALPALLFLLMVGCDVRAIVALGPRVLGVFACTMLSICAALVLVFLLFRQWLPAEGSGMFAALGATWVGGTANMVAVKQAIGLSDAGLSPALLTDALCYSAWVVVLFSAAPLAARFDRWTGADRHPPLPPPVAVAEAEPGSPGETLAWLGIALLVGQAAAALTARLPPSEWLTPTSFNLLWATLAGLLVAQMPLRRLPGAQGIASALLAVVVATMASQSDFAGLAAAPLLILCGALVLVLHALLLAGAAWLFRFDLRLCAVASLAQIGGVASAPVLAATYSPALVPVAVLLAMLGYILGTGTGLVLARLLGSLAIT